MHGRFFYLLGLSVAAGVMWSACVSAQQPAAPPTSQPASELDAEFQRVIANPADEDANLRYARAAERAGQPRKALATYERMLLNNPNNAVAREGFERLKLIADPPFTRYRLAVGGQFETNAAAVNRQLSAAVAGTKQLGGADDVAGVGSLRIDDERLVGGRRWRSKAQIYGDLHAGSAKRDFDYFSADTGPLFAIDRGIKVRPAVVAEMGLSKYHYLFHSLGFAVDLEFPDGWVKVARAGVSRVNFRKSENARDAWVYAAKAEMGWDGLFRTNDAFSVEPFVVFYDARAGTGQETFTQFGATLAYTAPVASRSMGFRTIYLIPELTVDLRPYTGREPLPAALDRGNRRDWRFMPGVKFVGTEFLERSITAILSYDFDRTRSNYRQNSFDNHRFALNVIFEF